MKNLFFLTLVILLYSFPSLGSEKNFFKEELVITTDICKSKSINDSIMIDHENAGTFEANFCQSFVQNHIIDETKNYEMRSKSITSNINYFLGGKCPKGYEEITKGNFYLNANNQKITACGNVDPRTLEENFTNIKRVRFFEKKCPNSFKLIGSTDITKFCKVYDNYQVLKMYEGNRVNFEFEKRKTHLVSLMGGVIIKLPILFENSKTLITSMIMTTQEETRYVTIMLDLIKKSYKVILVLPEGKVEESSGTFTSERIKFIKPNG